MKQKRNKISWSTLITWTKYFNLEQTNSWMELADISQIDKISTELFTELKILPEGDSSYIF